MTLINEPVKEGMVRVQMPVALWLALRSHFIDLVQAGGAMLRNLENVMITTEEATEGLPPPPVAATPDTKQRLAPKRKRGAR